MCCTAAAAGMAWFDAFRDGDENTYYDSKRTAVTVDINQLLISFFSFVVIVALLILVIGSRGREVSAAVASVHVHLYTQTLMKNKLEMK